ncbi:hypothetical protein Pmani_019197, partial [Petrolisthes manimaculis]
MQKVRGRESERVKVGVEKEKGMNEWGSVERVKVGVEKGKGMNEWESVERG